MLSRLSAIMDVGLLGRPRAGKGSDKEGGGGEGGEGEEKGDEEEAKGKGQSKYTHSTVIFFLILLVNWDLTLT